MNFSDSFIAWIHVKVKGFYQITLASYICDKFVNLKKVSLHVLLLQYNKLIYSFYVVQALRVFVESVLR